MSSGVLILNDNIADTAALKIFLTHSGYEVTIAFSIEQAEDKLQQKQFDIVVVDPKSDHHHALEISQYIHDTHQPTNILALVDKNSAEARITALEAGADDCLSMPYHPKEFLLRLKKLVRLAHGSTTETIDTQHFKLNIDSGDLNCPWGKTFLRKKEFLILSMLMQYRNQVVTKEKIIEKIWSIDETPLMSTIDVHVRRIRLKLRDKKKEIIRTSYGVGYMFYDK